jgi:ElaB/YqjD/DUF883 family membrane-anchored ribosome-binding protein
MLMQRCAEELASLKDELVALAGQNTAAAMAASREKADEAAKLLSGVVADIEEAIAREEENVENFIANRPFAAMASAFLVGVALGALLRRR